MCYHNVHSLTPWILWTFETEVRSPGCNGTGLFWFWYLQLDKLIVLRMIPKNLFHPFNFFWANIISKIIYQAKTWSGTWHKRCVVLMWLKCIGWPRLIRCLIFRLPLYRGTTFIIDFYFYYNLVYIYYYVLWWNICENYCIWFLQLHTVYCMYNMYDI